MLQQSGNNLELEGITRNKWESEVTRGNKQGITEKDKGTTEKKGNYHK